ncbi:protein FAR1-RELATED SEQUENCE 5-like [Arachis stenosperma]|uniref:protein FAR1-RELATED SEQUENCE 5-like n=1 Tax=Arachis stenosperma TaxID=217475 RepID=UPI0025AD506C|nr:protein FAR1-RELATED SEQUENCE 5-like [Arachis stenosperma]
MQLSDVTEVGSEEKDLGYKFAQLHMAHEFYVAYAKKVGFATKIRTTTCDKITKKTVNQAIHCNRDGFNRFRVKAQTRKTTISAVGCKARIYVKFDKEKKLTMQSKCVIEDNDEAEIRPNKTSLTLANEAGGLSNLGFSKKNLRYYITAKLRTSNVNTDVRKMMNYFMRMKDINPNFFYAVNLDEECKFRSVVWVDTRCRASYKYYGDIVSINNTYSTNWHGLPFVSFVGVNHDGTIPQRIITDQCRSIFRAIRKALHDTRHRWCIWHIMKKLLHKLGGYRRYRELYDDLNDIVWNSRMVESFEDNWFEFIAEYNLHNNTWLSNLYDDRRMWVPIYFKGEFWGCHEEYAKE